MNSHQFNISPITKRLWTPTSTNAARNKFEHGGPNDPPPYPAGIDENAWFLIKRTDSDALQDAEKSNRRGARKISASFLEPEKSPCGITPPLGTTIRTHAVSSTPTKDLRRDFEKREGEHDAPVSATVAFSRRSLRALDLSAPGKKSESFTRKKNARKSAKQQAVAPKVIARHSEVLEQSRFVWTG